MALVLRLQCEMFFLLAQPNVIPNERFSSEVKSSATKRKHDAPQEPLRQSTSEATVHGWNVTLVADTKVKSHCDAQ